MEELSRKTAISVISLKILDHMFVVLSQMDYLIINFIWNFFFITGSIKTVITKSINDQNGNADRDGIQ